MPKVYVANNKGYDLSGLTTYGEVVQVYGARVPDIFNMSKHSYEMKERMKDAERSDYLALVGNMILVVVAFGVLYEKFGFVNLLLFDTRTQTYVPRVLPKHQLAEVK